MLSLLSYLGSNWVLVILVVLGTAALGYVSFILRNWKLALAAVLLVMLGLGYQKANMDGYKRKVNEDAQAQLTTLKHRLATLSLLNASDTKRAQADQATISELKRLARETPKNDGACLGIDAARRVRAIK